MNMGITEECISGTELCLRGNVHVHRFQGLFQESRVLEEFAEVHTFKARLHSSFMGFYFNIRVCIGKVTSKIFICTFTRILNCMAKLQLVINADSLNVRNLLLLSGPLSQIQNVSVELMVVDTV